MRLERSKAKAAAFAGGFFRMGRVALEHEIHKKGIGTGSAQHMQCYSPP